MKNILLLIAVLTSSILSAQNYSVEEITINSIPLDENRTIQVYQPKFIENSDSVKVIFLLDGEFAGSRFQTLLNTFPNEKYIGVAITNTNRNRDMLPLKSPGGFLEFISSELAPKIDSAYNISEKILFGHSFAGGFTMYAMIHKPNLFDLYIASSPTPIMPYINSAIFNNLDQSLQKEMCFYFSCGDKDKKQVRKWNLKLKECLNRTELNNIKWENEVLEDKNHDTSDAVSLVNGIKHYKLLQEK